MIVVSSGKVFAKDIPNLKIEESHPKNVDASNIEAFEDYWTSLNFSRGNQPYVFELAFKEVAMHAWVACLQFQKATVK